MDFYELTGFSPPNLGEPSETLPVPDLPSSALFFDFDGTLVEIGETPDAVEIAPGLPAMLDSLMQITGGAVALVSGRSVSRLRAFLPDFSGHIMGSHGAEHFAAGALDQHRLAGSDAVRTMGDLVTQFAQTIPGLIAVRKPTGAIIHYRQAPEAHAQVLKVMQALEMCWPDFELHPLKMAYELRPRDVGKDQAIQSLMQTDPFRGRVPVFFGDDTTDEPALAHIAGQGGIAIKVGEGETAAQYRVHTPGDVIAALQRWSTPEPAA